MIKVLVCHRPDGLEAANLSTNTTESVCHRPDGLEDKESKDAGVAEVCHRPDGLEVARQGETYDHSPA